MRILPFSQISRFQVFMLGSHILLTKTISDFLSVDVKLLICKPEDILKIYNIDITKNIHKSHYKIDTISSLLIAKVTKEETIYFIGIHLKGKALKTIRYNKILNHIAGAVSKALDECSEKNFRNAPSLLNENLIQRMVASYLALRANYNRFILSFLIDKMKSLMATTFEGKQFSSGLIVTKSFPMYAKGMMYEGRLLQISKRHNLFDPIDNRFWYLVDGIDNFYITGMKDFAINYMYLTLDKRGEMQKMTPHKFLKGGDYIFRVYNGRELSIITKDDIEFIYQENVWRFRDYKGLKGIITEDLGMGESIYEAFISYILYCSKNEISSIIWIPLNDTSDELNKMFSTSNSIPEDSPINICNESYEGLLMRMLSSDGACVFNKNGDLLRYGCIIKAENPNNAAAPPEQKVKGTGESAAAQLASNGIAFKISQDGTIKFFHAKNEVIKF